MEVDESAEPEPQGDSPARRSRRWAVDVQQASTRPASCRAYGLVFAEGDLRLCTWGERNNSRWTCPLCLHGRLPALAMLEDFQNGSAESVEAAQILIRGATPPERPGAPPMQSEAPGYEPQHHAWEENRLPHREWWSTLAWPELLELGTSTFVQVPDRFRGAFAEARRKSFEALRQSRQNSPASEEWKLFLALDMMLLCKGGGGTCAEQLEERLAWFWGGQWSALWCSVRSARQSPRTSRPMSDKQKAARVHTLAASGEEGRALSILASGKMAPRVGDTLAKVKQCYPPATIAPAPTSQRPQQIPQQEFSEAVKMEVKQLLRRPARLTAPGLLGTSLEHLTVVTEADEELDMMADAVVWIAFGMLPPDAMEALKVGEIIALEKSAQEVRPLLLGSSLKRMGLRAIVRAKRDQLTEAAGEHQYGVGRKGGTELLLRKLEAQKEVRPTAIFLKVDLKAAFQTMERPPAFIAIDQKVPELAEVLRTWYTGTVKHLWRNAAGRFQEVESSRGFDQGCPLAPAAFSIALAAVTQPFYAELIRLDSKAKMYAYLDDIYLVVEASLAGEALAALQRALDPCGLKLNHSKTAAWSPSGQAVLPESVRSCGVDDLPVLGKHLKARGDHSESPVSLGVPSETCLAGASRRLSDIQAGLQRLQKAGLTKKAAAALLRTYAGAASQHSLRLELASDADTEAYDVQIQQCWAEMLERDLGANSQEILGLPSRLGGIGVQYASTRRFAAYLASWTAVAKEVTNDIGCSTVADSLDSLPSIAGKLEAAREGLAKQGLNLTEGGSLAAAVSQDLRQGLAVEKVQKNKQASLKQRLPQLQQAELLGASGPGAGSFLLYPSEPLCAMEDTHWETAARHRLQMEKPECRRSEEAGRTSRCSLRTAEGRICQVDLDDGGVHAATCPCGGGVVRKHARLSRLTGSLLKRWRFEEPLYEQRVPTWDRDRIDNRTGQPYVERAVLDIEYLDDDGRRWLDVSIRHSAAGSDADIRRAAKRGGEASRRGEREKHARYEGDRLVPFVLETHGRIGAEARYWLNSQISRLPPDQQAAELQRAYKCLSSTLQTQLARQLRSAAGLR